MIQAETFRNAGEIFRPLNILMQKGRGGPPLRVLPEGGGCPRQVA